MAYTNTDTRGVRDIARAILHEIELQGHVCLHAGDWGDIKANMESVKSETVRTRDNVAHLRDEVASMRGERKVIATLVGMIGGAIGGLIGVMCGRW